MYFCRILFQNWRSFFVVPLAVPHCFLCPCEVYMRNEPHQYIDRTKKSFPSVFLCNNKKQGIRQPWFSDALARFVYTPHFSLFSPFGVSGFLSHWLTKPLKPLLIPARILCCLCLLKRSHPPFRACSWALSALLENACQGMS